MRCRQRWSRCAMLLTANSKVQRALVTVGGSTVTNAVRSSLCKVLPAASIKLSHSRTEATSPVTSQKDSFQLPPRCASDAQRQACSSRSSPTNDLPPAGEVLLHWHCRRSAGGKSYSRSDVTASSHRAVTASCRQRPDAHPRAACHAGILVGGWQHAAAAT